MELTSADWNEYYEITRERPIHFLYNELAPFLPSSGEALELGCGAGNGVLFLLVHGLRVTGSDAEAGALGVVQSRLPSDANVWLVQSTYEDLPLGKAQYDVVTASFALFFMPPPAYYEFWKRLVEAIKPGGLFSGQFLGDRDEWISRGYTLQSADEVRELLVGFEILFWQEDERDGETAFGTPKHWHLFHVIARKA